VNKTTSSWISILAAMLMIPGTITASIYRVGGDFDYAPFTYIDKTGKAAGLEIDVLTAIAKSARLDLSIQLSSWEKALSNFIAGETDVLVGILYSEEREQFLDFSIPIHAEYYSIFIRKDLPLDDLSDLFNYKLVVLDKDVSIEKYLIPMGLYNNFKVAGSLPEALSIIELGLADYVIAPNLLGVRTIDYNDYKNIEIRGPSILPVMFCFAVQKGNTYLLDILNEGIEELRSNGELMKIQEKWKIYEKPRTSHKQLGRLIAIIVGIVLILLALGYSWVRTLRVQLKKQAMSLLEKNEELQKSEEKFRLITENASDVIWHLDSNLCLTYISPADERIRGYKRDEIIGHYLLSILKPEGIELIVEGNKNRLMDLEKGIKKAPVVFELEERCKDGSWVWMEATADAVYDDEGKITGYHGISRDITQRKKAELLLKERENQLSDLNATKDKVFSIIAHDLRTPFNSIIGFTDLLFEQTKDAATAETRTYIEHIQSAAKQTLTLLDNLLIWAKTQTGQNSINLTPINVSMMVRFVMDIMRSGADLKNIKLIYQHDSNIIEAVADMNMLHTVLRNLISNAIKFTHAGGEITITTTQDQDKAILQVADTGVGMNEETLAGLFKIGTTRPTNGTAEERGTGLGLVLCKELIEMQNGTITVSSKAGHGSMFTITLPTHPT
jgi:two-component system sensor histidine kinase/response regulator